MQLNRHSTPMLVRISGSRTIYWYLLKLKLSDPSILCLGLSFPKVYKDVLRMLITLFCRRNQKRPPITDQSIATLWNLEQLPNNRKTGRSTKIRERFPKPTLKCREASQNNMFCGLMPFISKIIKIFVKWAKGLNRHFSREGIEMFPQTACEKNVQPH